MQFRQLKVLYSDLNFTEVLAYIKGPNHNKPALVQAMAWHQTGAKPLPEPMLTQLTDTYI